MKRIHFKKKTLTSVEKKDNGFMARRYNCDIAKYDRRDTLTDSEISVVYEKLKKGVSPSGYKYACGDNGYLILEIDGLQPNENSFYYHLFSALEKVADKGKKLHRDVFGYNNCNGLVIINKNPKTIGWLKKELKKNVLLRKFFNTMTNGFQNIINGNTNIKERRA